MNVNDALNSAAARTTEQSQISTRNGNAPQSGAAAGHSAAATTAASDSVRLSATYQSLETKANGSFDAKKVAEIKAAIANGTFQVDPEKVAAGLLDTVKTLISARKA